MKTAHPAGRRPGRGGPAAARAELGSPLRAGAEPDPGDASAAPNAAEPGVPAPVCA